MELARISQQPAAAALNDEDLQRLPEEERRFVQDTLQQLSAEELAQLNARCSQLPSAEQRIGLAVQVALDKKMHSLFVAPPPAFTTPQATLLVSLANATDEALEQKVPCPGPCGGYWRISSDRTLCTHCMRTAVARVNRHTKKMRKDAARNESVVYHLRQAATLRDRVRRAVVASRAPVTDAARSFLSAP